MHSFLLSFVLFTASLSFAQNDSPANSPTEVIQEPKPKYTADVAKEEKKLSKKEKAKLKKWRAPRKVEPQKANPEKTTEDQIKDEDQSDLTPPE